MQDSWQLRSSCNLGCPEQSFLTMLIAEEEIERRSNGRKCKIRPRKCSPRKFSKVQGNSTKYLFCDNKLLQPYTIGSQIVIKEEMKVAVMRDKVKEVAIVA